MASGAGVTPVSRGRTVAVTGSASGIGAALCTRLRDGGAQVVDGGADAVLTGDDIWCSAELPEYVLGFTDEGRN